MIIQDIFPPGKIKKITKEKILGIRQYKNKRDKYFNISWRVLIAVIIFAAVFSLTGFPSKVFGEIGFFEEKIKLDITEIKLQSKYQQANIIKRNYKLQKSAFIKEAKDKNSIQIEVGDRAKDKFIPELTIRKWDDEVNLKVKYKHNIKEKDQTVDLEGDKIKWKNHKTEVHYYEMKKGEILHGDELESDVYEIEVILLEKPDTNVVEFDIETKGLAFYYQPALNMENNPEADYCTETDCYKNGDVITHRPENVVGSYAVYHESKQGDYSQLGGKNYRAGKAFHIYRPKIIDNAGKEVWGKLNINVEKGILSVEIPQEFLDNAVYPVIVDPTFGADPAGHGNTITKGAGDGIRGSWFNSGGSGTANSISFYLALDSYDDGPRKLGIYKKSDSSFIKGTAEYSGETPNNWITHDLETPHPSIENTDYYLVHWGEEYSLVYDDVASKGNEINGYGERYPQASWPTVTFDNSENRLFSFYCTYTAAATYQPRPPGVSPSGGGMMIF